MNERFFGIVGGLEFGEEAGDVSVESLAIVGGEKNGAAGETGFDGVVGGGCFARFGFGTGGELGIGAMGGNLKVWLLCGLGNKKAPRFGRRLVEEPDLLPLV
jgi:hypothetical protein